MPDTRCKMQEGVSNLVERYTY